MNVVDAYKLRDNPDLSKGIWHYSEPLALVNLYGTQHLIESNVQIVEPILVGSYK